MTPNETLTLLCSKNLCKSQDSKCIQYLNLLFISNLNSHSWAREILNKGAQYKRHYVCSSCKSTANIYLVSDEGKRKILTDVDVSITCDEIIMEKAIG